MTLSHRFLWALVLVAGCAGTEDGYKPLGEGALGFVGTAYGYADQEVSRGVYDISYHMQGYYPEVVNPALTRRADELCKAAGHAGASLGAPAYSKGEGAWITTIRATCGNKPTQPLVVAPDSAGAREAELLALQVDREIQAEDTDLSILPGLAQGGVASAMVSMVDGINQAETARIDARMAELGGAGGTGGGDCGGPQCKAAKDRATVQVNRMNAWASGSEAGIYSSATVTMCAMDLGVQVMEVCASEARAMGDTACEQASMEAAAEYRRIYAEAEATASQTSGTGSVSKDCGRFQ